MWRNARGITPPDPCFSISDRPTQKKGDWRAAADAFTQAIEIAARKKWA